MEDLSKGDLSPCSNRILLNRIAQNIPTGFISPNDEFFKRVNMELVQEYKKLGVISTTHNEDDIPDLNKGPSAIDCNVPGCFESFENVNSYQTHYNSVHRYLCVSCKRSLPTPHLLDLHISENHDTYFQARVDRGEPMFACYLEECKRLFIAPVARRMHCIDDHKFPSNFRFDQLGVGNKGKKNNTKMDVDPKPCGTSKKTKSYSFGQSSERSFNKTCAKSSTTLEDMSELMDALEE